mmetsp:Transcript_25290/g.53709  ORF Transcript_25290/g.53709 Transcript_25290/m.53709 type:complete len:246 (+) Transcript_25290:236-973(+)
MVRAAKLCLLFGVASLPSLVAAQKGGGSRVDLGMGLEGIMGMLGNMANQGPGGLGGVKSPDLCEPGQVAVPKPGNHLNFVANGCGPEGLKIDEKHGLYRCCNFHDVCFSVCGTTHEWCERQFKSCMKRVCKQPDSGDKEGCKKQAQSFTSMTGAFGGAFHVTSQEASCECVPADKAPELHRSYLTTFLEEYDKSDSVEDTVKRLLTRWSGKEGQMYAHLAKKHGSQFINFKDIPNEFERGGKMEL